MKPRKPQRALRGFIPLDGGSIVCPPMNYLPQHADETSRCAPQQGLAHATNVNWKGCAGAQAKGFGRNQSLKRSLLGLPVDRSRFRSLFKMLQIGGELPQARCSIHSRRLFVAMPFLGELVEVPHRSFQIFDDNRLIKMRAQCTNQIGWCFGQLGQSSNRRNQPCELTLRRQSFPIVLARDLSLGFLRGAWLQTAVIGASSFVDDPTDD
jgi:hypothetical protein